MMMLAVTILFPNFLDLVYNVSQFSFQDKIRNKNNNWHRSSQTPITRLTNYDKTHSGFSVLNISGFPSRIGIANTTQYNHHIPIIPSQLSITSL